MFARNNWKRLTSLVILSLWLTACETVISSCPPVVEYTQEEKNAAANEIERAVTEGYIMLPRMMGDYKAERAQLRACFN